MRPENEKAALLGSESGISENICYQYDEHIINPGKVKTEDRISAIKNNYPLPHDELAEKKLVSCLLNFQSDELEKYLKEIRPEFFYNSLCRKLFSSIKKIYSDGMIPELSLILNDFPDSEIEVAEIANSEITTVYIDNHLKIVKENFVKRQLIILSEKLLREGDCHETFKKISDISDLLKAESRTLLSAPVNALEWKSLEIEPPDPVIQGLLDKGCKAWIIGQSKARKSFFLLQLCLSLAGGKPELLNWKIPKKRRVLLVQAEITEAHYQERLKRMFDSLWIDSALLNDNLYILNCRGQIDVDKVGFVFDEISTHAKELKVDIIAFDPIYKFLHEENAAENWKPILRFLDRLCNETGAAVISCHHCPKGFSSDRQAVDRGAGSGVVARDMDCQINVDPHKDGENMFVVETIARMYPPLEPYSVRFESGIFKVDSATPMLKTRFDSMNSSKPGISEGDALNFFSSGVKPYKGFLDFLREYLSRDKAYAFTDKLITEGKIKTLQKYGHPKIAGLPGQFKGDK